jgi:hypothetical protein
MQYNYLIHGICMSVKPNKGVRAGRRRRSNQYGLLQLWSPESTEPVTYRGSLQRHGAARRFFISLVENRASVGAFSRGCSHQP